MTFEETNAIKSALRTLIINIHELAIEKKWYNIKCPNPTCMGGFKKGVVPHEDCETCKGKGEIYSPDSRNKGEQIALMHSELSEGLNALREPELKKDQHCPEFPNWIIELDDTVIRLFDFIGSYGNDTINQFIDGLFAKHAYNQTRPPKHGKRF